MDKLIGIHLGLGPLMLLISVLMKRFPPKEINSLYGYRTARSMKNQQAWNFANQFSTKGFLLLSIGLILFQIIFYFLLPASTLILLAASFLVGGLGVIIFLTERALKMNGF